jgi:hypothetical protein
MPRPVTFARLLTPLLLMAVSLALLAGCFAPAATTPTSPNDVQPTDIAVAVASPTADATLELTATPLPTDATTPAATDSPAPPDPTPSPYPTVWLPSGSPAPPTTAPAPRPIPEPTPAPTKPPTSTPPPDEGSTGLIPTTTGNARPTRIVVPALHIDLAVIKGDPAYPKCNVAQYMTGFVNLGNPGQPGQTTYIYAHARTGMFLPLLTQSKINNGANMIGMLVKVYTKDLKLHLYRINIVKRHAIDFSLATDISPSQHRLIMQTSEGPHGTIPKLQVAAKPIGVFEATAAQALPTPHPVTCG